MLPRYKIDKCTVVKACYYLNGKKSDTITKVYFIGFAEKEGYDNFNILSINCEPDDLFGYENGIYVCGKTLDEYLATGEVAANWSWWSGNYSQRHRVSEREATAQFFNSEGKLIFDKKIGVRIQGNSSRGLMPKNLNLYSRVEYDGSNNFPDVFGNGYKAHGLNLFAGSQDYCTKVRDAIVNELVKDLNVSTRQYIPCILFLNGEYWGVYFLTEKYDEEYFEHYYNIMTNNTAVVKNDYLEEGERKYLEEWRDICFFLSNADMTQKDNYSYACKKVDIQSYADYYAVMVYIGRYNDWPKGNIASWRAENISIEQEYQNGKWRYCLFDLNSGCIDVRYLREDTIDYVITNDSTFANLCNNEQFVQQFEEALVNVMEKAFSNEKIEKQIAYYRELLQEPMIYNNRRFFDSDEYTDPYEYVQDGRTFGEKLSNIEEYLINRKEIIYGLMEEHFGYIRQSGI